MNVDQYSSIFSYEKKMKTMLLLSNENYIIIVGSMNNYFDIVERLISYLLF